ncbi:NADP-dependent oxidoreductase [Qaidamihabitans albus]|uniref:NADP-dependent oxidoreductase n=1 Tax=Qaidamihabitans albus TaxID=2795733 RepID=UPI0027DE663F|nr:NADP-dependent oxidoreductase [Qaidamihabitans albus]
MTGTGGTMLAISQDVLGGPEVLRQVEVPRPRVPPNQVLVRVRAAGLNPTDWKHRSRRVFLGPPPFVLGWDVSGVVEEIGFGVADFRPGDEVFGMLPYPCGHGAHAEFVLAPARALVHKPTELDHVRAGALPLAALTAWQALVERAGIRPGQRVLVHGAGGGVGHLAVQIARDRRAVVIGTASAPKHDYLRELGAYDLLDHRSTAFEAELSDVDVVLDTVGGDVTTRSLTVLRPGGALVTIMPTGRAVLVDEARQHSVRVVGMLADADRTGMAAVADMVRRGVLRPKVDRVFSMSAAAEAHAWGESGRAFGKVVLVPD